MSARPPPVKVTLSVEVVVTSNAPEVVVTTVSPSASEVEIVNVPELLFVAVNVVAASTASMVVAPSPLLVMVTELAAIVAAPCVKSTVWVPLKFAVTLPKVFVTAPKSTSEPASVAEAVMTMSLSLTLSTLSAVIAAN